MKQYLDKSISFEEYEKLIDDLLAENKTTGPNQSEAMVNFTKLNRQRMQRLDKTIDLGDGVVAAAKNDARRQIWLIVTEAWCGDAAQNIPVIEKIAAESDIIDTRYILRDENLDLIDQFLTHGARSIPKLIALDADTLEVLGDWGARPEPAQRLFLDLKERGREKPLILENLQRWYNDDKGRTIQAEFVELIGRWGGRKTAEAGA